MLLYELTQSPFNPLLVKFWKLKQDYLKYYFTQNNCLVASQDLVSFLEYNGIGTAEWVPIGRYVSGQKKFGWIKVDVPDLHYDALTKEDIAAMQAQQLNPRNKADRKTYIYSTPELLEEFCWVPHSWVEMRNEILDPSGFYIDGQSGQFDNMVKDKSNLASRYHYF